MASKDAIIVLWVLCAVLLIIVIVASIYLLRRCRRDKYLVHELDSDLEDSQRLFLGYRRLTERELTTEPAAGTHVSPCVVVLKTIAPSPYGTSDLDILINIAFLDPSITTLPVGRDVSNHRNNQNENVQLLGNDSLYSDVFLRYTQPLEFVVPGRYVIQAHTVHPKAETVGIVHQFVFDITNSDDVLGSRPQTSLGLPSAPASSRIKNTIHINESANTYDDPNRPSTGRDYLARDSYTRQPSLYSPMEGSRVQAAPLPPHIIPESGAVTTRTLINIEPSGVVEQLRYSVDGGEPTMLYTGPFTLSLPLGKPQTGRPHLVSIHAIALRGEAVSEVAKAVLEVRPAEHSYFDPSISAPSMQIRALNAQLYFVETGNPPGARTCYELIYQSEARQKAKFSEKRCILYDGRPIPLGENVAFVYAWTVDGGRLPQRSSIADGAPGSAAGKDTFSLLSSGNPNELSRSTLEGGTHLRSVATIYDCARGSVDHPNPSRKRLSDSGNTASLLPPPVLCVSCEEIELEFDDAPANSVIAYTLNDKEPALFDITPPACAVPVASSASKSPHRSHHRRRRRRHDSSSNSADDRLEGDPGGLNTFIYQPGRRIRVTLLESKGVYVTARIFMPVHGASEDRVGSGKLIGYRYGHLFRRGFFFDAHE
ncbi:unnamed protein product [Phytomonas sp. EM1]|nr:unnamed protein product [Phytomonas sp. EM1]|eukprot:CCW65341.1 unnamed protein product [Phytomonas sp. isolate EM1]